MPEAINTPGDLIVEIIELIVDKKTKINLDTVCKSIILCEDIFSNVMSGSIVINDARGIISTTPLTGNDFITLSLRTPTFEADQSIKKSFYVTDIHSRIVLEDEKTESYVIDFISIESLQNKLSPFSKKLSGSTNVLIKKIFDEYLQAPRIIDDASNKKTNLNISTVDFSSSATFVSPFWTPFKTINWLAARSYTEINSPKNFLFFESNKQFYFKSVTEIAQQKRVFSTYIFSTQTNIRTSDEERRYEFSRPTLGRNYTLATNITPFQMFDIFKSHDSGHLASSVVNIDFTKKNMEAYVYDYLQNFKSYKHLNDKNFPLFSENTLANPLSYTSVFFKQFKNHSESKDPFTQNWALERNSFIHDLFNMRLQIEVPGRTDIEVGNLIYFLYPKPNVPSSSTQTFEDLYDLHMSGIYIITAIKHIVVPGGAKQHTMILEIAKDSSDKQV